MAGWLSTTRRGLAELRRRRVLRALGAYAVAGWLLLQVADATFEPLGLALWAQKALIIAVVAGIVPAAILAWIFDLTRGGIRRTPEQAGPREPIAAALPGPRPVDIEAASTVATAAVDPAAPMSPIAAIAILPFADRSQAQDH